MTIVAMNVYTRENRMPPGQRAHNITGKVTTVAGQIPVKEGAVGPKKTVAKKAPAKKAPGKAVARVAKPEEKSDFTKARATAHTAKIRKGAEATWQQIEEAYKGRIWLALGHKSWDEYCDTEFDGVPLALPREKKKQAIESLSAAGLSSRAIAAATGVSQRKAARDAAAAREAEPQLPATEPNGSVSKDDNVIDVEAEELPDDGGDGLSEFAPDSGESEGRTVLGQDGREINVTNIGKKATPADPVTVAKAIAKDLDSVRIRLESLLSSDGYKDEVVKVQEALIIPVGDFIDTVIEDFEDVIKECTAALHTPVFELEPEPA